ncbi:unnamed protein product [Brachionus calyciflorus]|uniref:EF-hand domain-containing protein n=1 Tax=Brachionus calyciflorus TaxID=104777 RepID=A0A814BPM9_9BILA|nr:unnamed protein product [Brachionus calyciflorus]
MDDENIQGLTEKDKEDLKKAFNKYDKKNSGNIKPNEIADVFRMAGQNPTIEDCNKMIAEAEEPGTGMLMFEDLEKICEKYWRNYENYALELREACVAFDRQDMGLMDFDEVKRILMQYGEQLDDNDIDLFASAFVNDTGKIIVDDFIKQMNPFESDTGKKKKAGKKGSAKK